MNRSQPNPQRRPVIGLSGRRKKLAMVDGFAETLDHLDADLYLSDYSRAVWQAGGLPVNLPMDVPPAEFIGYIDGLVLSGGADVDPARYGQANTASGVEPERDEFELALLQASFDASLPVFGICRGFQLINVACGGTLHQDVPSHSRYDVAPDTAVHKVMLTPGSILHDLHGPSVDTNTLHHQTIDTVGDGLRVTGRADDGTPEAIEADFGPVVAVQWHPEMMDSSVAGIDWLVQRASTRS